MENVAAKMAFVPAVPPIAKRDVKETLVHVILLCVELVHLVTSINMCVAKRANSFDGNMKFLYSVVLFMDQESPKVQERVDAQKESYRHTTWIGCDMLRLIERRIRLEEFCRQIEEHKRLLMWLDDSSSDDSDDNMPDLPN